MGPTSGDNLLIKSGNYTLNLPQKTGTLATLDDIDTAVGNINSALTTLNTGTGV